MSKVILVTGSNTGIGLELVRVFAEKGHVVYLSARNEKAGREAQEKLKKDGLNVKFVQLDVTNLATVVAAKETIEKNEGHLDVLVNNAGIACMDKDQKATSVSLEVIRTAMETNFFGLIQTTTTLLPLLRKSSQAVILNVTIDMASNTIMSRPDATLHLVAYNTSKAAANSYTIALAYELKADGIKVNCMTPGFTTTKLNFFHEGGKTMRASAEDLAPWALLNKDGPTGLFLDGNGKECPW